MVASNRRSYTLTRDQFLAMGGQSAPEGYDPAQRRDVGISDGVIAKKDVRGERVSTIRGTVYRSSVNDTDPNPGFKVASLETIQQIALHFQVKPLSIHWPDKYSPDFTAVPLAE